MVIADDVDLGDVIDRCTRVFSRLIALPPDTIEQRLVSSLPWAMVRKITNFGVGLPFSTLVDTSEDEVYAGWGYGAPSPRDCKES